MVCMRMNPSESLLCWRWWCERGDSNPHGLPRQLLRPVRLPIPPLSRMRRGTLASWPGCAIRRQPHDARARAGIAPRSRRPRAESASIADGAPAGHATASAPELCAVVTCLSASPCRSPITKIFLSRRPRCRRGCGPPSSRSTGSRAPPTTSPTKATPRPPSVTRRSSATTSALDAIERSEPPAEPPVCRVADAIREHALPLRPFRDLLSAFPPGRRRQALRDVRSAARLLPPLGQSRRPPAADAVPHGRSQRTWRRATRSARRCSSRTSGRTSRSTARNGRIYIPLEDLARFGVDRAQIAAGSYDRRVACN